MIAGARAIQSKLPTEVNVQSRTASGTWKPRAPQHERVDATHRDAPRSTSRRYARKAETPVSGARLNSSPVNDYGRTPSRRLTYERPWHTLGVAITLRGPQRRRSRWFGVELVASPWSG